MNHLFGPGESVQIALDDDAVEAVIYRVLFSTETGDAWLLDPTDHLAARVARDGDPEELYFEETDASFAIGWKGNYQINGDAFLFIDRETARLTTILGYPTQRLAQPG
jgi:hypothetical protein